MKCFPIFDMKRYKKKDSNADGLTQESDMLSVSKKKALHTTSSGHILRKLPSEDEYWDPQPNLLFVRFLERNVRKTWLKNMKTFSLHQWTTVHPAVYGISSNDVISERNFQTLKLLIDNQSQNLKMLKLRFNKCHKLNDAGMKTIVSQALRNLPNLEELSLDFNKSPLITDKGLLQVGSVIVKNLPKLKSLSLVFYVCSNITGEGIQGIIYKICRNLTNLEHLHFNFGGCGPVTDENLNLISKKICTHLSQLKGLTINKHITDKGLRHLASIMLPKLTNLEYLSLNFCGCEEITSTGYRELCSAISQNLSKIQKIFLVFRGCPRIRIKEYEESKRQLKETLKSLKKVNFDVNDEEDDDEDEWSEDVDSEDND